MTIPIQKKRDFYSCTVFKQVQTGSTTTTTTTHNNLTKANNNTTMSDCPIEHRLKVALDPGQKLTLDPPLTITREGHDDMLLTGLQKRRAVQYQATHKLGIAVSDFGRQTRARVVPVQVALGNARAAQRLVDALCVLLDRRVEVEMDRAAEARCVRREHLSDVRTPLVHERLHHGGEHLGGASSLVQHHERLSIASGEPELLRHSHDSQLQLLERDAGAGRHTSTEDEAG